MVNKETLDEVKRIIGESHISKMKICKDEHLVLFHPQHISPRSSGYLKAALSEVLSISEKRIIILEEGMKMGIIENE